VVCTVQGRLTEDTAGVNRPGGMMTTTRVTRARHSRLAAVGTTLICWSMLLTGCSGQEPEDVERTSDAIYYGTSSGVNFGIVEIYRDGNTGNPCTGYFISRRHIVTSAHCTDQYATYKWYYVRVKTGYSTFTYLKDTTRSDTWIYMTQSVFPGFNFDNPQVAYDEAILTLPATVSNVPPNSQLLRVSTAAPPVGQGYNIWGWGAYSFSASGPVRPNDLLFGDNVNVTAVSAGRFTATSSGSRLTCIGDSGGPATYYYSAGGYYVASGTHRGSEDPRCAAPGESMYWSDNSNKISWIESTIRQAYGAGYSCATIGVGSNAHMQCF